MPTHNAIKEKLEQGKTQHSLRYFIRDKLIILTLAVIICCAGLIHYIYNQGLDISARMSLTKIGYHYAQLDKQGALDKTHYEMGLFSVYIGQSNLPEWIADNLKQEQIENFDLIKLRIPNDRLETQPISHQENSIDGTTTPHFILLTAIPAQNDKQIFIVYLFYKALRNDQVPTPKVFKTVTLATLSVFLILLGLVIWLAYRFHQKVLIPIESLAQIANKLDSLQDLDSHPLIHNKSEIGEVTQALNQSIKRIHQAQQREKRFLENASHELRTPIAVISSSLDIIERRQSHGQQDMKDPLQHIRQSSQNMKSLTESLLWLSRLENIQPDQEDETLIKPHQHNFHELVTDTEQMSELVTEITQQLHHLIEGRALKIKQVITDGGSLKLERSLLQIVLSNLIRNAFEHSFEGVIRINISHSRISIHDTGSGITDPNQMIQRGISHHESFGLGLDIVTKIAALKAWHFTLENDAETGCIAKLCWQ